MRKMVPRVRVYMIILVLLASAGYAFLVAENSELARSIMIGYVGLLLTIFVLNEVWKHE